MVSFGVLKKVVQYHLKSMDQGQEFGQFDLINRYWIADTEHALIMAQHYIKTLTLVCYTTSSPSLKAN